MKKAVFLTMTLAMAVILTSVSPVFAALTYTACPNFSTLENDIVNDGSITFNIPTNCTITFTGTITIDDAVSIRNISGNTVAFNGEDTYRHFTIEAAGDLTLDGIRLYHGRASGSGDPGNGGSIFLDGGNLTVENSLFDVNAASGPLNLGGSGGAIYQKSGNLSISNSIFRSNDASQNGGALFALAGTGTIDRSSFDDNNALNGGGIHHNGGTLTITNSTISRNTTDWGDGAALRNVSGATMAIRNSTIADNHARGNAGGIDNNPGTLTLDHVSMINNTSVNTGPGLRTSGPVSIKDSIVYSPDGDDCYGSTFITPTGVNFDTDGTCPTGFTTTTFLALNLDSLANNGGPTETIALLPGSVAIDAATTSTETRDQRGYVRPGGDYDDAGAYEYGAVPPDSCAFTGLYTDGRINADHGCTPIAVYPDGAGGLEVYSTKSNDYHKGVLLTAASEEEIRAGLLKAGVSGIQEIVISGNGVMVYALPNSWIKIEIPGSYGVEFDLVMLAGFEPTDPAAPVVPYILPAELPQTGGKAQGTLGWALIVLFAFLVGIVIRLKK